ncbi:hypothetical protein [Actinocrinis sp.]|uniref:hypothetical protein n=1 Tax=Actinocrinis sp. TaxID=1920516 RepID=UPI002D4B5AAF|nr:hypothetical protein [Actinocrinis sp.]HZP54617.1 hypothetical protein [Actinocrinis sp.]
MFGNRTRILSRTSSVHWHPLGAVAQALIDWAEQRDLQQPLATNEDTAEVAVSFGGAPALLLVLSIGDAEELRRRLLAQGD